MSVMDEDQAEGAIPWKRKKLPPEELEKVSGGFIGHDGKQLICPCGFTAYNPSEYVSHTIQCSEFLKGNSPQPT